MKNEMLKCEIQTEAQAITFKECVRKGAEFIPQREQTFKFDQLPEVSQKWLALYGLRAALADRTSDSKSRGVNKLDWMIEVYDQFLAGEVAKRRTGGGKGIDSALIQLIVGLKGCSPIEAEAALKAAGKESCDAIAEKYADKLATIKAKLADAESVELDDLI